MRLPIALVTLLAAASLAGCLVPENMTALREELGYASVDLPDVDAKARATTVEPRVTQVVTLTAEVSGLDPDALTYAWDLGDGTEADGASVTHAWDQAGAYTVQLSVLAPELAPVTDRLTIDVRANAAPAPVITIESRESLVEGLPVIISATASTDADGDVLEFTWTFDGGDEVVGPRVEQAFDAGVHRVRLSATDGITEVVAFDSFGVARPLNLEVRLSPTMDTASLPFVVAKGAADLTVTLTHTTTLGLDDVDLFLVDATGNEVAVEATAVAPLAGEATETLVVDASQLAPGAYGLEARLVRGLGSEVAIEGVLTYSPLPPAT